jgi:hypothetical protein
MSRIPSNFTALRGYSSRTSSPDTNIDLIYFARPRDSTKIQTYYSEDKVGWYGPEDWDAMTVNAEVRGWCERALLVAEDR